MLALWQQIFRAVDNDKKSVEDKLALLEAHYAIELEIIFVTLEYETTLKLKNTQEAIDRKFDDLEYETKLNFTKWKERYLDNIWVDDEWYV